MQVIYEDHLLLGVLKPAGVLSQPSLSGEDTMVHRVASYLKREEEDLYLIHRLDQPVGGLLLFAKDKKTAASLNRQLQERQIKKYYLAVACGDTKEKDRLEHYLVKNQRLNISAVSQNNIKGAKEAILSYEKLGSSKTGDGILSLLQINLQTGRHHQIRVQMKEAGFPLWGDVKYNEKFKLSHQVQIALYGVRLILKHPQVKKELVLTAPFPKGYPFDAFNGFTMAEKSCILE